MAYARWERDLQDIFGNRELVGSVKVTRAFDGAEVPVYADWAGSAQLGNPFTVASGIVALHLPGGFYHITITVPGKQPRTLPYVAIGRAAGTDIVIGVPRGAYDAGFTYGTGNFVRHNDLLFISLADGNVGHTPDSDVTPGDTAWWMYVPTPFTARYELGPFIRGLLPQNACIYRYRFTAEVSWPTNLAGSYFEAEYAAASTAIFVLKRNGTQFGTVTFSAAGVTGAIVSTAQLWAPGDRLELWSPNPRDNTLRNINATIVGAREA